MAQVQLRSPLKNLSIYGSKGLIVIYGYNDITGLHSVLEINRPVITTDGGLKMKQLPQELTTNQMIARKRNMQLSYKDMELLYEHVHCLYGSIKLLDSHYLILVTKKTKIGSIVGHAIYSIDDIAILPVTFSMKSSADEARYRALLNTFDFTKYLYFSYTYDLTKSYQSQITSRPSSSFSSSSNLSISNSTSPSSTSNRSICHHMFVWNSFAMKPFLRGGLDGGSLDHWCVPVIYGYINQRNIRLRSEITLKFLLIARRSRLFAGTRYLRRGVDVLGNVANEVETEQIFYLMSSQPGFIPRVTSLIQCRGSIPLFWSHTNLYSPKPDVQLESDLEMRLIASKKHFENLFIRYGFNVNVLNLVKQVDSKGEVMLGAAYQETCDTLNLSFIGMKNLYKNSMQSQQAAESSKLSADLGEEEVEDSTREGVQKERGDVNDIPPITYIAYDFLTMAKYQHIAESEGNRSGPNVFRDVNKIFEGIYGNIGFYVDPPVDPSRASSSSSSPLFLHFPIIHIQLPSTVPTEDDSPSDSPSDSNFNEIEDSSNEMTDLFYELLAGDHPTHSLHSDELLSSLNPTNTLGSGCPTGLLQNGIVRTNCMDCLDRTNVAQFCYAKLNIMKQLKAIGINLLTSGLQEVINICMEVWAEHGDAIAIQYGGSGAMHKVDKQDPPSSAASQQAQGNTSLNPSNAASSSSSQPSSDQEFRLTGGSKNALVAVQRYYSNISTDYDRQQSIDLLLGIYEPKKNTTPIWEEKLRTQHLRFGVRGRRQSDLTASSLHDLNLLKQLEKVTKKEKIRNDLLFLQLTKGTQAPQQQSGEGKGGSTNGDFLILHDDEDEDDEEDPNEDEDDEEIDEIWEDSPQPENSKRKSIRIPLPGYQIHNIPTKPFHHIATVALDSLSEFIDLVEDHELEVVNLEEIIAFPFPPILTNDSLWSSVREKNNSIPQSSVESESPQHVLSPQEQLYSDYLNLSYTFSPTTIHVTCHCSQHSSPSTAITTTSSSLSPSMAISKTKEQSRSARQRLRQEMLKDFYSSLKIARASSSVLNSPSPALPAQAISQERISPEEQDMSVGNLKATPLTSSSTTPPPDSCLSQQTPFALKGIWPFRSKAPATPKAGSSVAEITTNETSTSSSTTAAAGGVSTNQSKRAESAVTESQGSASFLLPRPPETIVRKPSRYYEGLVKRYVDNIIDEKFSSKL